MGLQVHENVVAAAAAGSLALAALVCSTARADIEAFVRSGDKVTSDIARGEVEVLRIACADGDVLTATVRVTGRRGALVRVLDGAGGVLAESSGRVVNVTTPTLTAGEVTVEVSGVQATQSMRYSAKILCGPIGPDGPHAIDITPAAVGSRATRFEADVVSRLGGALAPERWSELAGARLDFGKGAVRRRTTFVVGQAPDILATTPELAPVGPAVLFAPTSQRFAASALVTGAIPYRPADVTKPLFVLVAGANGFLEPVRGTTEDAANSVVRFPVTRFGTYQVFQGTSSIGPVLGSTLTATDSAAWEHFGTVAIDGQRIVAGASAHGEVVGSTPREVGAAYVFERVGSGWQQVARLLPSDRVAGGKFGHAIAVDGGTIVVGAPHAVITASGFATQGQEGGTVYVYERADGVWTETARIPSPNPTGTKAFGADVALHGGTLVVGSPAHGGVTYSGGAFVYTKGAQGWTLQQTITPPQGVSAALFGESVALSVDTLLVGARLEGTFNHFGAAYVYVRSGGVFGLQQRITPVTPTVAESFGCDVALQGDRALIGAWRRNSSNGIGSAYVFDRSAGFWTQSARIDGPAGVGDESFGLSVALDGDRALLGAHTSSAAASNGGAVYLAKRGTGQPGSASLWTSRTAIVVPGIAPGDAFGRFVALHGARAVIGAPDRDRAATATAASAVDAGAVYTLDLTGK